MTPMRASPKVVGGSVGLGHGLDAQSVCVL